MNPTAQPQGIESILQALAIGGQPIGQLGKLPGPMAAPSGAYPASTQPSPSTPGAAAAISTGAADPLQAALADATPEQLQLILQALLGGAFNQQVPPG